MNLKNAKARLAEVIMHYRDADGGAERKLRE